MAGDEQTPRPRPDTVKTILGEQNLVEWNEETANFSPISSIKDDIPACVGNGAPANFDLDEFLHDPIRAMVKDTGSGQLAGAGFRWGTKDKKKNQFRNVSDANEWNRWWLTKAGRDGELDYTDATSARKFEPEFFACRSREPDPTGSYQIYLYDFEKYCPESPESVRALTQIELTPIEIATILYLGDYTDIDKNYCVSDDSTPTLALWPDYGTVEALIQRVRDNPELFESKERTEQIAKALEAFVKIEASQADATEKGKEASSLRRNILISLLGTLAFVVLLEVKEWKNNRGGVKLINEVSDDLKNRARAEIEGKNFPTKLEDMDDASREMVERNEELTRRPAWKRRGRYNLINAAPRGWGKDPVRFALVARNRRIVHRDTSDRRMQGMTGGEYRNVEERVHSRLPESLRTYQAKAALWKPWNLIRPWRWRGRQIEFQYDEAGRMRKRVEDAGKVKNTVFLQFLGALADGSMRVTGFTTPTEAIDLWRMFSHDEELKPFKDRFQLNWAKPKTVDDVVKNLKRGEKAYRKQDYKFTISQDAYELMAKAGQVEIMTYRIPKEDLAIVEGSPYVKGMKDIGVLPDEFDSNKPKPFVELTMDQGHTLRAPLAIYLDVIEEKINSLPDKKQRFEVTYDDVARVIAKKHNEPRAILATFYPEDAKKVEKIGGPVVENGVAESDPRADHLDRLAELERLFSERYGPDWAERLTAEWNRQAAANGERVSYPVDYVRKAYVTDFLVAHVDHENLTKDNGGVCLEEGVFFDEEYREMSRLPQLEVVNASASFRPDAATRYEDDAKVREYYEKHPEADPARNRSVAAKADVKPPADVRGGNGAGRVDPYEQFINEIGFARSNKPGTLLTDMIVSLELSGSDPVLLKELVEHERYLNSHYGVAFQSYPHVQDELVRRIVRAYVDPASKVQSGWSVEVHSNYLAELDEKHAEEKKRKGDVLAIEERQRKAEEEKKKREKDKLTHR